MTAAHTTIDTPVGPLTLVALDGVLSGVYFPGHWTLPDPDLFGERVTDGFEEAEQQFDQYFAAERRIFTVPTVRARDGFQRRVWELLTAIPYGRTTRYGDLTR